MPLAMIVILAAVLRFGTLGVQSFSDDELFTVWLVKMSFSHMLSTVPHSEATPPLFYVLEWVSARAFGFHEVGIRILSATAGTLTVLVIYLTGTQAASRRVGLAAAAFAAVDPFLIWYSQEARAYALMILFVATGLLGLAIFIKSGSYRALWAWALSSALALASHYFALFLVLPEMLWVLLAGPAEVRRRVAAVAVPCVVGLALLPLALHQRAVIKDPGGIAGGPLWQRLVAVPKDFLVGFSIPAEAAMIVVTAALVAVALALAVRQARGRARSTGYCAAALAVSGVALPLVIAPLGFNYLTSRNVVAVLVPVALVLGVGFSTGRVGFVALVAFGAVSVATAVGIALNPRYQRPDWRGAAQALGPAHTDRLLIFNPPFSNPGPFRVYFGARSSLLRPPIPRVSEVDVLALQQVKSFGLHQPTPPVARAAPAPAGFRIAENVTTSTYRFVRYTSPAPRLVSLSALEAIGFRNTPAVLISQTRVTGSAIR